jgi:hypothetical protein
VNSDEPEYELEFATAVDGKQPATYHVHNGCFWAWESERRLVKRRTAQMTAELSSAAANVRFVDDDSEAPGGQKSESA